ncbi:MAG: PhoH family protein [Blastochloris viridis]|uniref:PhoH-like protein n=1 Tax=Blastochloris viridis TaxID=1079 RepID=A0A6N4RD84_BLAVI|nr:MAG: PhoH family protein [Blastochloris viridis]
MPEQSPLQLTFSSNQLLQDLCGRHDAHLQLIEDNLGVQLVTRGNQLAIFGPAPQAGQAKQVLEDLYELLKNGVAISPSQVEAALRLTDGVLDNSMRSADLLSGSTVIATPQLKLMPRSVTQHRYVSALQKNTLVFGTGPAGTGKTYLAVAQAVSMLVGRQVSRIILTRPVLEAGERLGFLPGTFEEKIDPYLRPLFDALDDTLGRERWAKMRESGQIEIAPLAYMRGRTIKDSIMLLDEAQNTTPTQMKMFLTRLGENSRMFVTGDPAQSDLPPLRTPNGYVPQPNGLKDAIETLDGLRDIEIVRFRESDVVRHPLVSTIVTAYAERERQLNFKLGE